jgi:hypothetical protein
MVPWSLQPLADHEEARRVASSQPPTAGAKCREAAPNDATIARGAFGKLHALLRTAVKTAVGAVASCGEDPASEMSPMDIVGRDTGSVCVAQHQIEKADLALQVTEVFSRRALAIHGLMALVGHKVLYVN